MNEEMYVKKIEAMIHQFRDYRKANPNLELLIRFNAPDKVMVCAAIQTAVKHGFLSVNPSAMDMFEKLGWIKEGISYLMLKVAIEHEQHATADEKPEAKTSRRF